MVLTEELKSYIFTDYIYSDYMYCNSKKPTKQKNENDRCENLLKWNSNSKWHHLGLNNEANV